MKSIQTPVGRGSALVHAFTPQDAVECGLESGWSLKGLQKQSDVPHNPMLVEAVLQKLESLDVSEAFAPHVAAASAQVVCAGALTTEICLSHRVRIRRDQHLPADGVSLWRGQVFVMSAAGCPIITATGGNLMVVAHAGRDSLIDRGAVMGKRSRRHMSIVDAVVEFFTTHGVRASDIAMVMQLAIPVFSFEHNPRDATYGDYNRFMIDLVDEKWAGGIIREDGSAFLCLEKVFLEQARQCGVRDVRVENALDEHPDLVQTCVDNAGQRNLIVVKREE